MMDGDIAPRVLLDYVEFRVFPSQNRYEARACRGVQKETVTSGLLKQLSLHSPDITALQLSGTSADFRLNCPENSKTSKWFTKETLTRFLRLVDSSDALDKAKGLEDEISQLEEARRFHLSLYAKANANHDCQHSEADTVSSDASKNELLRAMDLRLTALRLELAATVNQAAGSTCSPEDLTDMEKFSHHFGAAQLRNILCRLVDYSHEIQNSSFPSENHLHEDGSGDDLVNSNEGRSQIFKSTQLGAAIKYDASPAKVAQIERRSSSESEESPYSSEEDKRSEQRSRTMIRSASPRRSASPMRRIQIGRSGSRRSTALTIKSLSYFPARERVVSQRDAAAGSDEEAAEQAPQRSDQNIRRLSVQDAISLFESKQRDQSLDIQKTKSLANASMNANKSVLRRWSAGMGDTSSKSPSEVAFDIPAPVPANDLEGGETDPISPEPKMEFNPNSADHLVEPADTAVKSDSFEEVESSSPSSFTADNVRIQTEESSDKLTASAEWNRQKEAELNQLLMRMMETKPVRKSGAGAISSDGKAQKLTDEQRGGLYNKYKERRDEKLRETANKRVENDKQFRALQQILDERKAEMVSAKVTEVGKGQSLKKPQKSLKNTSVSPSVKKEATKPAVVKKAPSKTSPVPATRKSWPSAPSPRLTGTSGPKTPPGTSSSGNTPISRRSQPASSVPRTTPKAERAQPPAKPTTMTKNDMKDNPKNAKEKKQQIGNKTGQTTKSKVQASLREPASSAKPSLYSKVTKKSSVVPLESKPFLRKGSGIGSGVGPNMKAKSSSQPEEHMKHSVDMPNLQENNTSSSCDLTFEEGEKGVEEYPVQTDVEPETVLKASEKCEDAESPAHTDPGNDADFQRTVESVGKIEDDEELNISPTAWVELEEHEDQPLPSKDNICEIESVPNTVPARLSSPRVRHSLSQMLLEESSEPDALEWGNAENPPAMVYQKDAPKGLKRLLKFARKSKTDSNSTGWSSPSVFSEGEDDAEESRVVTKKGGDNLLKKATLQAKNHVHQKTSREAAPANLNKFSAQILSQKLQESHISTSATTSKASRSFFSLSAFKGNKQNEAKFR